MRVDTKDVLVPLHSDVFFLLLIFLWGLPSSRSPWWREGHVGQQHLAMPRPDQSYSWIHTYYIYNINSIRYNFNFAALVCTCDTYCMSVSPGRGIPPLWIFLRFPPSFFPPLFKVFFFLSQYCKCFLTRTEGLRRMSFTEQIVKPTETVIVILGYIDKIDLIWR